jgi:hypothetical protein
MYFTMTDECWIGNDLDWNNYDLIYVLSWHAPGVTEENHDNFSQDKKCPSQDLKPNNLPNVNRECYYYINCFGNIVFNSLYDYAVYGM